MSRSANGGSPTVAQRPPELVAALVNGALVLALLTVEARRSSEWCWLFSFG
jgi:hypothetical protein